MIYAVIDTNVLVSALLSWDSVPGSVLEQALTGEITPALSTEILDEYDEVLKRPKFSFDESLVQLVLDGIIQRAVFIDPIETDTLLPDANDTVFYNLTVTARENNKNAYLVTGNLIHFPEEPFVLSPRGMLDMVLSCKDGIL